jgi:hypothetical protein
MACSAALFQLSVCLLRTAQGHKLRDQARIDSAAAIVDAAFQRLLGTEYAPALTAAYKLKQGQLGDAEQGAPKRQRVANPLLPQHQAFHRAGAGAAAAAAGRGDMDEVITAFVNGEDGFGPSNTQVCSVSTAWVMEGATNVTHWQCGATAAAAMAGCGGNHKIRVCGKVLSL